MIAAEMSMPVQRMLDGDGWPPVSSAYPRVEQMYQTLFEERARNTGRARARAIGNFPAAEEARNSDRIRALASAR